MKNFVAIITALLLRDSVQKDPSDAPKICQSNPWHPSCASSVAIATADLELTQTPVMDLSNILNKNEQKRLTKHIKDLDLQIVIVDRVEQGASPKKMATKLFNSWKLGNSEENNGLLLLVAMEERRIELEVGTGLNALFSARWCRNKLEETVVPWMRQKEYSQALHAAAQAIRLRLEEGEDRISFLDRLNEQATSIFLFFGTALLCLIPCSGGEKETRSCLGCGSPSRDHWDESEWKLAEEVPNVPPGTLVRTFRCRKCSHEGILESKLDVNKATPPDLSGNDGRTKQNKATEQDSLQTIRDTDAQGEVANEGQDNQHSRQEGEDLNPSESDVSLFGNDSTSYKWATGVSNVVRHQSASRKRTRSNRNNKSSLFKRNVSGGSSSSWAGGGRSSGGGGGASW